LRATQEAAAKYEKASSQQRENVKAIEKAEMDARAVKRLEAVVADRKVREIAETAAAAKAIQNKATAEELKKLQAADEVRRNEAAQRAG
jgi:hypothetical protein